MLWVAVVALLAAKASVRSRSSQQPPASRAAVAVLLMRHVVVPAVLCGVCWRKARQRC